MKKTLITLPALVLLILPLLIGCRTEKKADAQPVSEASGPEMVEPVSVYENDFVKVVHVVLDPGQALASHEGEERIIYSLSDYAIDWEEGGQDLGTKAWKTGEVHVHEAGQHAAENKGDSRAEWLAFVRKTSELPTCEGLSLEKDVNLVAGEAARMLYDDESFRVTEINLKTGESLPMHDGINRVIYALSDYTISYWSDETKTTEKVFKTGEAHWHEGCQHSMQNNGDTVARYLVVAFK